MHQYATGTGASYQGEDVRAVGTFGPADVMGMATVVAFGLVCAVALALGRRVPAAAARGRRWLCALALLVAARAVLQPGRVDRHGRGLRARMLVLAGLRRAVTAARRWPPPAVILVGGLGVGSAMLQERVTSITQVTDAPDQSVTDRYTMWAAAADMWREHPLTGVGLKGFPDDRDGHASLALSSGSDIGGRGRRLPQAAAALARTTCTCSCSASRA